MSADEPDQPTIAPSKARLDARATLLQAADSPDPLTRTHAIEALAKTLGDRAGAVYLQALDDSSPIVRFAAAMAVGDTRYADALGKLQAMARRQTEGAEPDKRVFTAVVYALYALGDDSHAAELGPLLFDDESEVRMNAAMAMGRMGEPSAIGPLKTLTSNEQDEGVKLQVTESLARLGDSRAIQVIEAYTKGYFLDLRLAAIPALARTGTSRARRVLASLTADRNPARVRVLAAGELARLGTIKPEMRAFCRRCLREPRAVLTEDSERTRRAADDDAESLKRLAALALGKMDDLSALDLLHPMLRSKDGGHRVAAALSILRLTEGYRMGEGIEPRPAPAPAPEPAPATQPGDANLKMTAPAPAEKPEMHTAGGKD